MRGISSTEARKSSRPRVLDMALIRFGEMSVGCVIRNLTDEGAALDVGTQSEIPDQFTLVLVAQKKIHSCTIIWRKNRRIGVSFY
jgi:PilZ domain